MRHITCTLFPVIVIARELGPSKAMMPAFHALTGCDTTSAFFGKGKKTAWSVWQSLPELTLPLQLLACPNPSVDMMRTHTAMLERFVIQLYGVYDDDITSVDAARRKLLLHKGRNFEHIPPSSDALHQNFLRVDMVQSQPLRMGMATGISRLSQLHHFEEFTRACQLPV